VKKAFDSVSHSKLLRVLSQQGVPHAWVGLVHHLLSDRCTLLGDVAVPVERGTPQGSPLSPLSSLFSRNPSPSGYVQGLQGGVCVCEQGTRCLLLADDTCLVASSLSDLQRVLGVCSQWAAEVAVTFNTRKSHLLHLFGPPPGANTAPLLSGQPLQWTQEVTYLGVALKRSRTPGKTLPLELLRLWAALYKTGAALSPAVPVPLAAQLQLTTTDVLAGVLLPRGGTRPGLHQGWSLRHEPGPPADRLRQGVQRHVPAVRDRHGAQQVRRTPSRGAVLAPRQPRLLVRPSAL
jgi:hypothetical protein